MNETTAGRAVAGFRTSFPLWMALLMPVVVPTAGFQAFCHYLGTRAHYR